MLIHGPTYYEIDNALNEQANKSNKSYCGHNIRTSAKYKQQNTLFFYDKIFLSAENPETVRFYSPYQQDHDINYTTVREIKTSTARGQ